MLSPAEVEDAIRQWEGTTREFKREFATDAIREALTAFANDYAELGGGVIIVGVDPVTREVVGVSGDPEETLRRIAGLCRDGSVVPPVAPEIYQVEISGKRLAVVEVKRSDRRPHRANNICYIRIGPTTRKATPDEEFELVRRSGRFPFDLMPLREASIEDLDFTKFTQELLPKRLSTEILAVNGRSPLELAEHLRFVIREGDRITPTVAAVLLFGKQPQRFLPHSAVDFIRFEGDDPSYPIKDRKEITGTVDQLVKDAVQMVEQQTVRSYEFRGRSPVRRDIVEYPLRAVREAVTNAVMHRDYEFSKSRVSIKMFDDRLEIFSPGGLYGIVTKENFGTGVNDYRNPTLAVNMNLLGLAERAGTGIFLIRRQMVENGSSEPVFDLGDRYVTVRLPAHPHYLGTRLYQRGVVELESGHAPQAEALLRRSATLVPHLPEVWAALGRLEALYGHFDESRQCFQRAIAEDPTFEKAYLEWSRVEDQQGHGSRAQDILKQGTLAVPESAVLWHAAGLLEEKLKNPRKALVFFRKAASLRPEDPKLQRSLARAALRLGELDEAVAALQSAAEHSAPDDRGPVLLELMRALIRRKAPIAQVGECFHKAYQAGFRPHELFHAYYRYLTSQGQHAEALRVLELASTEGIRVAPALPQIYLGRLPAGIPRDRLRREIRELFARHGIEVANVSLVPGRGFAFVSVPSEQDVVRALEALRDAELLGKKIAVDRKR